MLLRRNHLYVFQQKQLGAALILIAFLLALMAGSYMVKSLQGITAQRKQDEKTMQALNEAKAALIAWSVNHQYTPGQMPWPDRGTDGNYDGSSDCVTTPFQNSNLLGQLPHLPTTSPCLDPNTGLNIYAGLSTYPGIGQEFLDAQGNRIWYAVSKNLVYDYETSTAPIINPGIANTSTWLKVLDRNGNLISDRVAVVLMAPGAPLPNQNRSGIAGSTAFLDEFEIGLASYNNHTYAIAANEFVMGEDYKHVPNSDTTFTKPYLFNDKLVFITIDELMAALEKRVGEKVRSSLKTYQDTNGYYPYAAHLGTSLSYIADGNLQRGFLPIFQNCSYVATSTTSRALNCTQPIFDPVRSGITTVRFYLPSGTFTSSTGSCTRQSGNTRCYCTGAGACSRTTFAFTCSANSCSAVGTGATGDIRIRDGKLTFATGGCSIINPIAQNASGCPISNTNTSRVICNSANGTTSSYSNSDIELDSYLPAWFETNEWQNYVYYELTRPAATTLTVGTQNTESVIVTTGGIIAGQTRPSCNAAGLNNYLDSIENTDGDTMYDATFSQRSANYNDQTFVVEP